MRFKFGKVNISKQALLRASTKSLRKSSIVKAKTRREVESLAKEAKKELISNFEQHPVTKEIEAGSENNFNFSRTLQGLGYGKGSLFGFIGFVESDKPMDIVRLYLSRVGRVSSGAKTAIRGEFTTFTYKVTSPNMQEIESITPMPWEGGRSWIRAIERGISGLGYYLLTKSKGSRSGQGVQVTNQLRTATYRPTKYMSNIIKNYGNFLRTGKSVTKR